MAAFSRTEELRLIERAAAGDREAAGAFISAHQHSLYAYLLRMSGRPEVAEDVAQEAFVRVLTNLDRFDPRFRFSTWLFTIARRLYINTSQKLRPVCDTDGLSYRAGEDEAPGLPAAQRERREVQRTSLQSALMELSIEQREVLVLFHQLDWPICVIAQHMSMPEGTVKSHLHRGRRRLRDLLAGDERFCAMESEVES
ncbi:MAG: sigma-70 family RNA polymerase sigma factor [Phycisphaeraceae bacterium]|nr:sigma-70 family RNA polymerase sigma factor [Phycisphaeraceae bacterium]MCW5755133.1 sigma-70 family RNA polymerase sigma factor [Phycisphaeraceae bacterium]